MKMKNIVVVALLTIVIFYNSVTKNNYSYQL